jgi:hypothetical protein
VPVEAERSKRVAPRHKLRADATPAYYLLKQQRRSMGAVAQAINVPYIHLRNVLYGAVVPSPEIRGRLPLLLGVPIEELFDADVLKREFAASHRPKK